MRCGIYSFKTIQDVCRELSDREREADLYCVTQKTGVAQFNGKEVITAEELDKYPDYAILVYIHLKRSAYFQCLHMTTYRYLQSAVFCPQNAEFVSWFWEVLLPQKNIT